jgi:hypothetical protein
LLPLIKEATAVGRGDENKYIRWHRYRSAIRIWDLTNAGKRGKMVEVFALYDLDYGLDEFQQGMVETFAKGLPKSNFRQALKAAQAMAADGIGKIESSREKGVRVNPAGFKPLELSTPEFEISSDLQGYSVRDRSDKFNEPACYNRGKRDVKPFYRWVTDNWPKLKRLTYSQLTSLMSKQNFNFHSYCRMD